MTDKKDARLYNAARRLADCWASHLGPAPKQPWYDGHQEMEQALVRFGRFVNDIEGGGQGDKYIQTAKFLLDCRYTAAVNPARDRQEYDQSHLPVTQQYEAVGHAVRATYTYSGMADVAVETHDPDYQSAVRSLWDNIVNKKYYLTGGIGSGETSEGFGPNYSLRNNSYCESCSSCGMIFFHWKMNLAYHDALYADHYEETMYNALLGSTDLEARKYYYTNPLDANLARSSWHTCPCCVGNIARTLLMAPTWTYAKAADGIYVNMYIGSTITLENAAGTDIEMVQETDYPWSGKIAITVNPKKRGNFAVRLRVAQPDHQQTLHARAGSKWSRLAEGERHARQTGYRKRLRSDRAQLESGRPDRARSSDESAARNGRRPNRGHKGQGGAAVWTAHLQHREGGSGHHEAAGRTFGANRGMARRPAGRRNDDQRRVRRRQPAAGNPELHAGKSRERPAARSRPSVRRPVALHGAERATTPTAGRPKSGVTTQLNHLDEPGVTPGGLRRRCLC